MFVAASFPLFQFANRGRGWLRSLHACLHAPNFDSINAAVHRPFPARRICCYISPVMIAAQSRKAWLE